MKEFDNVNKEYENLQDVYMLLIEVPSALIEFNDCSKTIKINKGLNKLKLEELRNFSIFDDGEDLLIETEYYRLYIAKGDYKVRVYRNGTVTFTKK